MFLKLYKTGGMGKKKQTNVITLLNTTDPLLIAVIKISNQPFTSLHLGMWT